MPLVCACAALWLACMAWPCAGASFVWFFALFRCGAPAAAVFADVAVRVQQVQAALNTMRTVLEVNKRPQVAADVPHAYSDKYLLAEFVTR